MPARRTGASRSFLSPLPPARFRPNIQALPVTPPFTRPSGGFAVLRSPRRTRLAALALAAVLAPSLLPAQRSTRPRASHRAASSASTSPVVAEAAVATGEMRGPVDTMAFTALHWREIGPYRGGRSVAVAGSAARPYEYWFGSVGGGVFKSTDGGDSWQPMSDKYFGGTIGAIGVSESNPDIVYVGTGEYDIRGNVSHGEGVFRTADGGKTWKYVGLADTRQISRVRVDPRNPDVVYVAALGHVWAPNADRGIFKSTDGGATWRKVLFVNDSTGAADLVLDPTNPSVMYASFWQAGRTPWLLVSGGAGSGIYKSTDAGEHWTNISHNTGLPSGIMGNIGLAVSPANPQRVWALIEAKDGGVYRSDDGGTTWTRLNSERKLLQRAWYYMKIFADPKDANVVYALNTGFYRSKDGGKTFQGVATPHGDNHDLWIAPNDPDRMIESNDGGANVSFNGGKTWSEQDQATAQFYHVVATNDFPYQVCGAQQDNSTVCIRSASRGGIDVRDWDDVGGGESGYIAVRPDSTNIVYAGSYGGLITRLDRRTGITRDVNPWPDNPMGHSAEDLRYRFQWTFPIVISPHDPQTLYVGSNVLFRSTNDGQSYTQISPDLTRHVKMTLGPSGGPLTKDQTSVEYYATIFAIAESPVQAGEIWTGSDDGMIQLTRDGGKTWANVTPQDFPEWTRVSIIEPSHYDAGTAYVAANRYQLDDNQPYLYRTTDYGKSWTRIDAGIDRSEFTRAIREDPVRRGLLFAGTERGVWTSFDDGATWQRLQRNLPPVPVHDLAIKNGDLIAATHGRAFYIMDDISALRQLTPQTLAATAHLFAPQDAYRVQWGGGFGGPAHPVGQNPPSGAVVQYWLSGKGHEVTLDFLDANGHLIRHFTSAQDSSERADSLRADSVRLVRLDSLTKLGIPRDSAVKLERRGEETTQSSAGGGRRRGFQPSRVSNRAGVNSFVWNMRYPDASSFSNIILWAGSVTGPVAPPGTYQVRMAVDGKPVATEKFRLLEDPNSKATAADLAEQFALEIKIRDALSQANDAVKTIRNIRQQMAERQGRLSGAQQASFATLATAFDAELSPVEDSLYQTQNRAGEDPLNFPIRLNNRIAALEGVVADAETRPTDQAYMVFRLLNDKLSVELKELDRTVAAFLPRVNAQLATAGLEKIVPKPVELKPAPAESEEGLAVENDGR